MAAASGENANGNRREREIDDSAGDVSDAFQRTGIASALRAAPPDALDELPGRVRKQAERNHDERNEPQRSSGDEREGPCWFGVAPPVPAPNARASVSTPMIP